MEIAKNFVVKASPDEVWRFLIDPRRVAQCLPGATITEQLDERTHAGTVTMKVGPVTASFKGTMRFDRIDPATRTAEIVAAGQDVRGKGGADMRMSSRLVERSPGETEVAITSNVNIVGTLAQFGRGIIQDVADQVFEKFVGAVRAQLETSAGSGAAANSSPVSIAPATTPHQKPVTAAPPIDMSGVVGRAAGRTARRPLFWVGVLAVLFLFYWFYWLVVR
jgi:carbon monoxide dehydrogenase subunit G